MALSRGEDADMSGAVLTCNMGFGVWGARL